MIPFNRNRQIFVLLRILPPKSASNSFTKYKNIIFSMSALIILTSANCATVLYIVNNYDTDLAGSLCAIHQIVALICAIYMIIAGYILRNHIRDMFEAFQTFYDSNLKNDPTKLMEMANQRGDRIAKFFMNVFSVGCSMNIFMAALSSVAFSLFKYGYIDQTILFRPYKFILPWDQQTTMGWVLEICFSLATVINAALVFPSFLILFISICEWHQAFFGMFSYKVNKMATLANSKPTRAGDIKKMFREIILFHLSVKSLFQQTAQLYSSFILVQLVGSMIYLACALFQMDLGANNLDESFFLSIFAIALSGSTIFFYCFNGKRATYFYAAYADCLYESNWVPLSNDFQKYLILMIANAQEPLHYHGCGIVYLNLETFRKILKTVISYYLMFKTFTK